MSSTKDVTFKLKCEVDEGALKSVDSIEKRLEDLNKHTKFKLEFDTSDAESGLSKIEKRLEELKDKANIKVTMDDDGVSSRRKSTKSSTRQSGRLRQPSRPRANPDAPTEARPSTTARTLPSKAKPRNRAGAAKATASRSTKAPTARGRSVRGGGRLMKPMPGRLGAVAGFASLASGFLTLPENNGRVGPEAYGGSAEEYSDVPTQTSAEKRMQQTAMILDGVNQVTETLKNSTGAKQRDVDNLTSTATLALTGSQFGPAGAAIGAVAGGSFTVGNSIGRRLSGQDEAEEELAANLEREQMLIDGTPAMRKKYRKENLDNLAKIEREQSAKFKMLSGSDADEFKTDLKGVSGSSDERLSSLDGLRAKNESQRVTAAKEAARLADVLAMAEKAGPNTSLGMQSKGISRDLDAQNLIVKQQEEQLTKLAEERLKIEKEIAKTRTDAVKESTIEESPRAASSSEDRTKHYADRIGGALEKLTDAIETKINRLSDAYTNVRNGG